MNVKSCWRLFQICGLLRKPEFYGFFFRFQICTNRLQENDCYNINGILEQGRRNHLVWLGYVPTKFSMIPTLLLNVPIWSLRNILEFIIFSRHKSLVCFLLIFKFQVGSLLVSLKRSWLKYDLAKRRKGMETYLYYLSPCWGQGEGCYFQC